MGVLLETLLHTQTTNSAFALDPLRRQSQRILVIGAASENTRLAAVISTVYTVTELFKVTSSNQTKRINEINQMSFRLLAKIARKITKSEIYQIEKKLDLLCSSASFQSQPSWSVYVSFCLALLNDEYEWLEMTRLAENKQDIWNIIKKLNALHEYMAKKEGKEITDRHIELANELCKAWHGVF